MSFTSATCTSSGLTTMDTTHGAFPINKIEMNFTQTHIEGRKDSFNSIPKVRVLLRVRESVTDFGFSFGLNRGGALVASSLLLP